MRTIYTFLIVFLLPILSFAQATGDFRSNATGNWNSVNTWDRYDGSNWINPAPNTPTNSDGVIHILNGHTVTVTASVTTDQTTIDSGGAITVNANNTLTIADGTGDDLTVNGTLTLADDGFFNGCTVTVNGQLVNGGTVTINSATLSNLNFQAGSKYQHAQDGGNIPMANWNSTSICEVTGIASTVVGQLNQSFGDLVWNSSGQSATLNLGYTGTANLINGNFKIQDTGGQIIIISTSTNTKLTVTGNLEVSGSARFAITTNIKAITVEVGGNYSNSSTGMSFIAAGDPSAPPASTGLLDIKGNFTQSAGTLVGFANAMIDFSGSNTHSFTAGGTFTNVNFTVKANSILDLGTSAVSGGGTFTLDANSELRVGSTHSSGAIQASPATNGNIQVSGTRTYASNSRIVFNGTAAQVTGDGSIGNANLTINNSNGVSLNNNLTVNGALTITSGNLTIGTNTLTLNGTIVGSGNIVGSSNSHLGIGGTGALGTLNLSPGTLGNLTINRLSSGTVTLGSDLTINGTLSTTAGTFEIDGKKLTISGPIVGGSGVLSTNASSEILLNGSGAISGNMNFITADILGVMTINRNGATLNTTSSVVIDSLNLTLGTLGNTNSLQMSSGGDIVRSGGTMSTTPGGTNPYDVFYDGATDITTGNELPSSATLLNDLAVRGSATFTLNKAITINGDASFTGGTFATGTNNITINGVNWLVNGGTVTCGTSIITMNGDNWTIDAGSFNPGTGKVVFADTDTIGGTGTIDFNNFEIASTGKVVLPSGTIYVSGTYQANSGATVDPNNGTVELDGSSNQIIAAGGTNLNDININKSGGTITIQNLLKLNGTLDVQTGTTVSSGGNLTLVSTSDNGSGDARIATLPSSASITGDVTIERSVSGKGRVWKYITPTVTGATVADWQDSFPITGNFTGASTGEGVISDVPSLYYYDETVSGSASNGWTAYPTTSNAASITSATGYSAFMTDATNISLTGPINQGNFSFAVSYTNNNSSADGWNLLGNPYPSQINWSEATTGWTKTNIGGTVSIMDDATGTMRYWNGATGTFNGNIAIGQSFWIQASGSNPVLAVTEVAKTNNSAPFYRTQALTNHIKLSLTINDTTDYTFIHFRDDATDEFDWDIDGHKFPNPKQNLYSIIDDSIKMAINSLELVQYLDKKIKIGISNVHPGDYTLGITDLQSFDWNNEYKLIDHFDGTTTDIPTDSPFSYTVTVTDDPASWGNDRLELDIVAIITGLEEDDNLINIFPNPGTGLFNFKIKSDDYINEAILMDTKGSIVKLFNFAAQKEIKSGTFDLSDQKKGLYLLRIKMGSNVIVKKLAVE